ncbi:MAG: glycine zipper family protein [Bacteroidota bacterium]
MKMTKRNSIYKLPMLLMLVFSLTLMGCANMSKSGKGAAIGAGAGAAVGAIIGKVTGKTATGAIVGAIEGYIGDGFECTGKLEFHA